MICGSRLPARTTPRATAERVRDSTAKANATVDNALRMPSMSGLRVPPKRRVAQYRERRSQRLTFCCGCLGLRPRRARLNVHTGLGGRSAW